MELTIRIISAALILIAGYVLLTLVGKSAWKTCRQSTTLPATKT